MSKRYSFEFKTLVRKVLRANKENIVKTALFVDIPERTLRDWQREWRHQSAGASRAATTATSPLSQRRLRP